uniref:Ycf2 N-terminal domain-containing protein n=1 Tax=Solanum lycopersicum TaxID=4081 RepID=A0A3Q7I4S7_SOLLC
VISIFLKKSVKSLPKPRNWIEKKRDSSCKISNETIAGIEILFKEKDLKYLEFLFVYYIDDPIRKDHDWKLFDRLSLRFHLFLKKN